MLNICLFHHEEIFTQVSSLLERSRPEEYSSHYIDACKKVIIVSYYIV